MSEVNSSTIAAISTALSESGIGIIRVSGPDAVSVCSNILFDAKGNKVLDSMDASTFRHLYVRDGEESVDECIVLLYRAPHSYTGEDIVEIQCHGGIFLLKKVLDLVIKNGAVHAMPGEFTRRAFLNGKMDLAQAEAVMDLISSRSEAALRASRDQMSGRVSDVIKDLRAKLLYETAYIESAIDDPEHYDLTGYDNHIEEVVKDVSGVIKNLIGSYDSGRFVREGIDTCIAGRPNSGKSSLLNLLTGQDRAIVSDIPGTTRDTIEEYVRLDEILLKLTDTAGIRKTDDPIESIGTRKAMDAASGADLILFMIDASDLLTTDDMEIFSSVYTGKCIIILNKADKTLKIKPKDIYEHFRYSADASLQELSEEEFFDRYPCIIMSASGGQGLDDLKRCIKKLFMSGRINSSSEVVITGLRHKELLMQADESLSNVLECISSGMETDIYTVDLYDAYRSLGLIIGEEIGDDLANEIFSKFCMGK
ncbi:MAG: tRNA uridine-5-carboxymethylaminomethyl(34) synthesis GTPase MnmE [Lachnospiraceae bacterium]|nr:tRNA uridine-5-carboxymethylaminomethyl(34) synthesis GTPase MnmE [Lachnospiraceae bacterium]